MPTPVPQQTFLTAIEAAALYQDEIRGKTILFTGISPNSLATYTASAIAHHHPRALILCSRSASNLEEVADRIRVEEPGVDIRTVVLNLSDPTSIRTAVAQVLAWRDIPSIDILILSAGVMGVDYQPSKPWKGIEMHMAINHVGHFLFTNLLTPKVTASAERGINPRIIVLTSAAHKVTGKMRWDSLDFEGGKEYSRIAAYGQSKFANILFAVGLADRLEKHNIRAFALHPGYCPDSNIGTDIPSEEYASFGVPLGPDGRPSSNLADGSLFVDNNGISYKTVDQGAASQIIAAFDRSLEDAHGGYLWEGKRDEDAPETERVLPSALDPEAADRLWSFSEGLVGQTFSYQIG